ncbi:MAG TPA: PilZ domain-containing protein [Gammaproteobacteria bacterium]
MKSVKKESVTADKNADRRQQPRYNVELRVQLIGSGMLPMHVRTVDVSSVGIHFDCDRTTAQHLMPPGESVAPDRFYTARFKIPDEIEGSKTLTVVTKVIDVRPVLGDSYRVSMRFARFGGQSRARLESYLSTLTPGN